MNTCELRMPGISTITPDGGEDPRIVVALAALMVGAPDPLPGTTYPEPWKGIIARVGALPLDGRLEALGRELENLPGVDTEAILNRVFAADPAGPGTQPPTPIPFPFPTTIVDQKRETESPGFETLSLAAVLAIRYCWKSWLHHV